ncbi:MAG TPA: TAXI family TRAP transporter solute-binding subunit [Hyphomicrobiaceae bacterium]|nr:TAXI family TRAP transporter solute-binding subunit [Hyphomicrobiaceae bacterium]
MDLTRRAYLGGMTTALGASLIPGWASAQVKPLPSLPSTMIWSVGDDDGPRYREAQAIADAISKAHGTRIRLQASERAFGRVEQLKERQVTHGFLGMEAYFAAEGLLAYVAPTWGPQDLRGLLGRMSTMSIVASEASGITKLADIKGKRIARTPRHTALGYRLDALLEAGGIAAKDLNIVEFENSSGALGALAKGEVDCAAAVTNAPSTEALDAIADAIVWIELPASDKDFWARLQRALPPALPYVTDIGPGISKSAPKALMGFRDPVVTVYADAGELEVYAVTKAIADNFELYKDATPLMARWELPQSAGFPTALPYHEGAVRFLKEKGVWSADHQRWQDGIMRRHERLRQGWAEMMSKDPAKSAAPAALAELWAPRRAEILKSL